MSAHHDSGSHHVTPLKVYITVAMGLFALTILTVVAHQFHHTLGVMAAPVAFLIATVKAVMVMLWFMHLKYENMTNRVIFGCGFLFLAILFIFCETDILTRVQQTSTL